jgi:hypothetical protein
MACETYRDTKFRQETLDKIVRLRRILKDYPNQKLSARQVFYQFVSRGWLENTQRSYKNITGILADARYAGLVDWDAIEDRGREPTRPPQWRDLKSLVGAALSSYRLDRWEGQRFYVEVWCEKAALAGVLSPVALRSHVTMMVNRGYSSASAMRESAQRFLDAADGGRAPVLLYLGDHDPSGEDMVRDVRDRLVEFGLAEIEVVKLALTMEQIRAYNPPPNPAKVTDSRAAGYIAEHGSSSWELDALPPDVLTSLVEEAIDDRLDHDKMAEVIAAEDRDKSRLRKAVEKLRK